jgi:hypothetical protein
VKREHEAIQEINQRIEELARERERRIAAARVERDQQLAALEAEAEPVLAELQAKVATAGERAQAQAKAEGVRETIGSFEKQAGKAGMVSLKLTMTMEALDRLRQQKLDSLPIPGLEMVNGQVLVDQVPWNVVNTSKKIEIAFQIWDLWQAPFGVLDDAEHFDSETWEAFKQYCQTSGRQVIAARVSDGPLKIEVLGPAA